MSGYRHAPKNTLKILVIDDEIDIARYIQNIAPDTCTVEPYCDPLKALDRLRQETFDLIISDVRMPSMTGYQFLKKVRDRGDQTPAILISGHAGLEMQSKGLEQGACCCIEKPFRRHDILSAIDFALGQSRIKAAA